MPGFARKYRLKRLVWYEATPDVMSAIERETQLKGWLRRKKLALIEATNPAWHDLAEDFVA